MSEMIRCKVPGCDRELKGKVGYASHLRWHVREGDISPNQYEELLHGGADKVVVMQEKEVRRLRANLRRANRRASHYADQLNIVDRVCSVVRDSLDALPPIEPPKLFKPNGADHDETVVLLISDVHVGKKTPTYNHEVFAERMGKLMAGLMNCVQPHRSLRPLRKIVVVLNGDIMDAESIYPGQSVEKVSCHIIDQIYTYGLPEFVRFFEFLLEHFEEVEVHAVMGNHGRLYASKWTNAKSTNWDVVFYHSLKTALRLQERLNWNIYDRDWKAMFNVNRWGFLATHGDMIRQYYNTPTYGISRQATRWQATYRQKMRLHYFLFGHFHTLILRERFNQVVYTVNGSWVTDDSFAEENMGVGSVPEQAVFAIHPEWGWTWSYPLNLE